MQWSLQLSNFKKMVLKELSIGIRKLIEKLKIFEFSNFWLKKFKKSNLFLGKITQVIARNFQSSMLVHQLNLNHLNSITKKLINLHKNLLKLGVFMKKKYKNNLKISFFLNISLIETLMKNHLPLHNFSNLISNLFLVSISESR